MNLEAKFKSGLVLGFFAGIIVPLCVGAVLYYPKFELNNAMQYCNKQFDMGSDGVTDKDLSKFPSQKAFEAAYTACVNERLK